MIRKVLILIIFVDLMNFRCEATIDYYGDDNEPDSSPPDPSLYEIKIIDTKEFNFVATEYPSCKNEDLKSSGKFFISKALAGIDKNKFQYFVTLNKDVTSRDEWLANAFSERGIVGHLAEGATQSMHVEKTSRYCGLATFLTYGILTDRDVLSKGGFDLTGTNSHMWAVYFRGQNAITDQARLHCNYLVGLTNVAKPREGARSFIKAGIKAGYEVLFTFKNRYCNGHKERNPSIFTRCGGRDSGGIMELSDAFVVYGTTFQQAKDFLNKHGNQWFFCKSKPYTPRYNGNEIQFTFSGRK